jgi:hypothetical protein
MKRFSYAALAALLAVAVLAGGNLAAQQSAAHNHIGHVTDAWRDTPDGQGLLPAAIAEAEIAARHAGLAASDPSNFAGMKRHTTHVLHAVDPSQIENGPGLGYGVKRGAAGAAQHITAAANSEGASGAVQTHAVHVATSAQNTVARADQIVALAQRIARTTTAADAAPLVAELNGLAQALLSGVDANGDGRTGWQEGEGGLEVAQTHANLMKQAEGL